MQKNTGKKLLERPRLVLAAIISAKILFLLWIFTQPDNLFDAVHGHDSRLYANLGHALARTGAFAIDGIPHTMRTPGYPLVLALGDHLGSLEGFALLFQFIVHALAIWMLYKIVYYLTESQKTALFGGAIFAFDPLQIPNLCAILPTGLFTSVFIAYCYFLVSYFMKGKHAKYLVGAAITIVVGAYLKPVAYFIPVLQAVGLLGGWAVTQRFQMKPLIYIALFFTISAGLIGIWNVRNSCQTDYSGFSSLAEVNLYFFNAASVVAAQQNEQFRTIQTQMYNAEGIDFRDRIQSGRFEDQGKFSDYRERALSIIAGDPLRYAAITFEGMAKVLFHPGGTNVILLFEKFDALPTTVLQWFKPTQYRPGSENVGLIGAALYSLRNEFALFLVNGIILAGTIVLYIAAIIGVIKLWKSRSETHEAIIALLILTAYLLFSQSLVASSFKYRLQILPIIVVFAACGIGPVYERLRGRLRNRRSESSEAETNMISSE